MFSHYQMCYDFERCNISYDDEKINTGLRKITAEWVLFFKI